jgi:hypothetical protein
MKKMLLLLIAVATGATVFAQSTTSPVTVQTGKLDGKTFNITLVAKSGDDTKNSLVKPPSDVAQQNQSSTMNTKGTMNTTTTTSNTGSTSTTEVMDKTDAMTGNVNEVVKDEKPAEAQVVTPQPAVPQDNTTVSNSNADYSLFTQPLTSNKTTITFNNNMLESPMLTERKLESCPYKVTASEADMTLFTATCRSASPPATAIWSGMVTGKSIKGSVSYRLGNGQTVDYSFTGTMVITKKTNSKTKASTNESSSKDDSASR